ncbi:MAG: hypothetical protein PHP64_05590 [Actinomycetota bacterium]|nr:hypothetical protein [Actinomycetota bacterium]
MTDKDVERNVRSSTTEGIKTPAQRHTHGIGEKHAIPFGEKMQARKAKNALLEKFRQREAKWKKTEGLAMEGEDAGRGEEQRGD